MVLPLADNLHVINICDAFPSPKLTSAAFCIPVVTHADGTLVTFDSPAQAGEEVVIWAYGSGYTSPAVQTGQASPTPAATVASSLYLQFDFRPNATPSRPYINPDTMVPMPPSALVFVGLMSDHVGVYQINVTIPSPIPDVVSCRSPFGTPGVTTGPPAFSLYNIVQSNLTIDIGANQSFDGAAICVQPRVVGSSAASRSRSVAMRGQRLAEP
jgi:hypothetical protein